MVNLTQQAVADGANLIQQQSDVGLLAKQTSMRCVVPIVFIPAGVPHFVAANDGTVVVQLSGIEKFQTDYVEK